MTPALQQTKPTSRALPSFSTVLASFCLEHALQKDYIGYCGLVGRMAEDLVAWLHRREIGQSAAVSRWDDALQASLNIFCIAPACLRLG